MASHCWERKETFTSVIHRSVSIALNKSFLTTVPADAFNPISKISGFDAQRQENKTNQNNNNKTQANNLKFPCPYVLGIFPLVSGGLCCRSGTSKQYDELRHLEWWEKGEQLLSRFNSDTALVTWLA